jgi:predicted DNA-binding transcriptional regulator AlpA
MSLLTSGRVRPDVIWMLNLSLVRSGYLRTRPHEYQELKLIESHGVSVAVGKSDRMLSVDEVAERLSVRKHWCYEHAAEMGAVKMFGVLRWKASELDRWVSEQALAPQR